MFLYYLSNTVQIIISQRSTKIKTRVYTRIFILVLPLCHVL